MATSSVKKVVPKPASMPISRVVAPRAPRPTPTPKPVTKASPKRARAEARPLFDPERRGVILQSALVVFAEKGFHRATIRDIAKVAKLAEGTIYNHFENKTALMISLFESLNTQGREKADLGLAADMELADFLPAHFRLVLDLLTGPTGKALPVILAELLTNAELREAHAKKITQPNFKIGEQALRLWAKQSRVRKARPELTVRLIGALLLGTIVQRLLGDDLLEQRWAEVPDAIAELVLTGVSEPAKKSNRGAAK
jgi:AcrR family transcriptional regulator